MSISRMLPTDVYIAKAIARHGDAFDYSKTIRRNSHVKVTIICRKHGEFQTYPNDHLRKDTGCCKGCKADKTSQLKLMTTERFVEKAKEVHGDKYCYDHVDYKKQKIKVWIVCNKCLDGWNCTPSDHLQGSGCPECNKDRTHKRLSLDEFIKRSTSVYGEDRFDFGETVYEGLSKKVSIRCLLHELIFDVSPESFLGGHSGCPKCDKRKHPKARKSTAEFVSQAKLLYGDFYDYSLARYTKKNETVIVICPNHGKFDVVASAHIYSLQGCPKCNQNVSAGELAIARWLDRHGIYYEQQARFSECRRIKTLPFDFYIPVDNGTNILIEFDGLHHFIPVERWGGESSLSEVQERDRIKDQFAEDHGFTLIRIPYWNRASIPAILEESFS